MNNLTFADAESDFESAKYLIFGAPFDWTTSYRPGTRFGPDAIREASYNFEPFNYEFRVSLSDIPVFDSGNLDEWLVMEDILDEIYNTTRNAHLNGKFPIMLGGEHSMSPGAVKAFEDEKIAVLIIDAHLDFRESYLGSRNSHACAHRRIAEIVGVENVISLGVRSISDEEKMEEANFIDSFEIKREGIENSLKKALKILNNQEKIYMSLDIDGLDPIFAPGTGTPEPFGLTDMDVKYVIDTLAPRMVAFDLVEVSPPYDHGQTANLAARLVREVIAATWVAKNQKA